MSMRLRLLRLFFALQVVAERMKAESVTRAIMVISSNLTPFAKQCLLDLMPRLNIEQFTVSRRSEKQAFLSEECLL